MAKLDETFYKDLVSRQAESTLPEGQVEQLVEQHLDRVEELQVTILSRIIYYWIEMQNNKITFRLYTEVFDVITSTCILSSIHAFRQRWGS